MSQPSQSGNHVSIYVNACVKAPINKGESPICEHLSYVQSGLLDRSNPEERVQDIQCDLAWLGVADLMAIYQDLGISVVMHHMIDVAKHQNIPCEYRTLSPREHL